MCEVMEVSRSGYYAWRNAEPSPRSQENASLRLEIESIFEESNETYGSPRVAAELNHEGFKASRPRVARIMKEAGLKAQKKRKSVPKTTDSDHDHPICPNLLARNFEPGELAKAWVSDITYIPTNQGWRYLTVVLDLGDRSIIGWAFSQDMTAANTTIKAFNIATKNRKPKDDMIFHSDRGSQYACHAMREAIGKHPQIRQSMSRKADCWDNAVAESFFHTLKNDAIHDAKHKDPKEVEMDLFQYIEIWYNRKRRHSSLGYLSPLQFANNLLNS